MARESIEAPELRNLGENITAARKARSLSQAVLAERCALRQSTVSSIESGRRRPTLDLLFRIARALDVPIQRLISGSDRPGIELRDIAVQLRNLGIVDLWVQDAVVPCAFRRPEEVIVLAVRGVEPDARIITALPAVLAWNAWDRTLMKALSRKIEPRRRLIDRLAWLADIALAINRRKGFPGGCRTNQLIDFVRSLARPQEGDWDSLGRPMADEPRSPLWRRWRIRYDADFDECEKRAVAMATIGQRTRSRSTRRGGGNDAG